MGFKHDDACLAKVADDEPIFVLRAQDKLAPMLVRLWAALAEEHGADIEKIVEANQCAQIMHAWQVQYRSKWPD